MARIAINGLGRIGRTFLKLGPKRPELEVVAVNDLGDLGTSRTSRASTPHRAGTVRK